MRLDRNNDSAVRDFEDWVRRELYGPNDGTAEKKTGKVSMEDEYEYILSQLTESQISLIIRMAENLLGTSVGGTQEDLDALEDAGLIEYTESIEHKESHTRGEVSAHGGGRPRPSKLGREWVAWYKKRPR